MRKCGTGTGFPMDWMGNAILSVVFECAEVGTQCVELWARDAAGNEDYCESYVVVQDNLMNCPGGGGWNIRVCAGLTACSTIDWVEEDVHFQGIKIGYLNCTAVANYTELPSDERSEIMESISIGLPSPNPTDNGALLPLFLPGAENVQLEISDISGKLLWVNNLYLEKGRHALEIPALALTQAGVYVWRVRAGEMVRAGKIVRY